MILKTRWAVIVLIIVIIGAVWIYTQIPTFNEENTTVPATLTPDDPGVKEEFQRIANTPYNEQTYNCLNKSRDFHTYILLHDSKANAYLRTIYHSTGNYAHAFVQWNGQAYDPTNPEWYGVDYQKYLTKMAEEGFNSLYWK